jgi:hypothetical protein
LRASSPEKCTPITQPRAKHERAPANQRVQQPMTGTEARRPPGRQLSSRALSRKTYFWIFPVAVVGSSPNTTFFGILNSPGCAGSARSFSLAHAPLRLQLHERARRLAPLVVRPRDHRGELRRRVLVERDLDLDRGDVLAAPEMMMSFLRSLIST